MAEKIFEKTMALPSNDFFFTCKECILENSRSFYGSFALGPFRNSQSLTLANAIRRTLLTEIMGIAITHVELDGVAHEYATLDGVRESIFDILFNFKQIVLKTSVPCKKPTYGYLDVRGPGIVRISDLKLPPHILCVDPDQYVATLNENGRLRGKVTISDFPSFFRDNDMSKKTSLRVEPISGSRRPVRTDDVFFDHSTNALVIDALFTPVQKVNYLIERLQPTRHGRHEEILHLELWTNGSLHPRKAFSSTFSFLKTMFDRFEDMETIHSRMYRDFFETDDTVSKIVKSFEYDSEYYSLVEKKKNVFSHVFSSADDDTRSTRNVSNKKIRSNEPHRNRLVDRSQQNDEFPSFHSSIDILELPSRIALSLHKNNFKKIEDLTKFTRADVGTFCGLGNFSLSCIQKKLRKFGFDFKKEGVPRLEER